MLFTIPTTQVKIETPIAIVRKVEEPKKPEPIKIIVQPGDTLTSLATTHQTTVERLWQANLALTDPNTLEVNQELIVPLNTDVLQPREMPSTIQVASGQTSHSSSGFSVSGNSYSPGYCTFYVKNMRPDLPNNLGSADTWYVRYGGAKGSTPQVGAVGVAVTGYMHVVYITGVNGDGTVNLSEMNYKGWNVVSTRTAPASDFLYLY